MNNFFRLLDKVLGVMLAGIFNNRGLFVKSRGFAKNLKSEDAKILLIKFWGLGNLAIIWPLIDKIRQRYPNSCIIFFTFDLNKGFLERNGSISKIVYFKFTRNIFLLIKQFVYFVSLFRKEKPDIVINFETFNLTSALFSFLTGAPFRAGINNNLESKYYNYWLDSNPNIHISKVFTNLLKPFAVSPDYKYHYFDEAGKEKIAIEAMLKQINVSKFICIQPGTSENFKGKRWGIDKFSGLSNLLIENYGFSIIFTGGKNETHLVKRIMRNAAVSGRVFDFSGKLDVYEFIELIRKSHLFISNDTGPAHIAFSLGVNTAVIYGPTTPEKYGSLNDNSLSFYGYVKCSPCVGIDYVNKRCRNKFKCLDIDPREVFLKISQRFLNA